MSDMDTRNNIAPPHLTLRQLSCFVTVAEECHFRRAAARLHMSQPPLTQRIQDLERDLGVELFTRTGHRIELTEAGRLILAEAKATLAQADRVREVARRVRQGEIGVLRVSVRSSVSFVRAFREASEAFRRDYPHVGLDMVQTPCHGTVEALHQQKIDACVLRRVGSPPDGLHQVLIASDRLMLVLPLHHPKALAPGRRGVARSTKS
jgi:DNA-binding transcriptional LysR family regulator